MAFELRRCAEIMQALLGHNADVDFQNRIVLINAAGDLDDLECLRILVDASSHLNWRDCHKRTAVGIAVALRRDLGHDHQNRLLTLSEDPDLQHIQYSPPDEPYTQLLPQGGSTPGD